MEASDESTSNPARVRAAFQPRNRLICGTCPPTTSGLSFLREPCGITI